MLRRSHGPDPFDPVPNLTYPEVLGYLHSMIELIRPLIADRDQEVSTKAGQVLTNCIGECTVRVDPEQGTTRLAELGQGVICDFKFSRLEEQLALAGCT